MEIIVCIKQVPGTSEVEVDPETGVLKREGVESKMNPYDLYGVETALRLKESCGARLTSITMGPPQAEAILREAFMMGVDRGVLLSDRAFAGADVLATAYALSQGIAASGSYDLVICGKQTTDGDTAQVGPEIAEYLDIPHITSVCAIKGCDEGLLTVENETDTHRVRADLPMPCLIMVDKGIYQPRLPSYVKKKETRNREIIRLSLADLDDQNPLHYGLNGSPTQVKRIFPPETRESHERWSGTGSELAERLFAWIEKEKFVSGGIEA